MRAPLKGPKSLETSFVLLRPLKGFQAIVVFAALFFLICVGTTLGQEQQSLSPRIANYTIEVRLDAVAKTLKGREIISWRNETRIPAKELWFHLYWNAWKNNKSTWLREDSLRNPARLRRKIPPEDWAYLQVKSIRVLADSSNQEADRTSEMRYVAGDDGDPDDQTVLVVPLVRAVWSQETIRVEVVWESKIPRTFAMTGFRGDFFFVAQWFPKLGVYQADGNWNCHQFHANTEFFSDYGVYDVQMTVPKGWLLGATGVAVEVIDGSDGTSTHHYRQEDVHDFAWTTSPDYREARRRFEHPGLKAVDMRLLFQPEHSGQVDSYFNAAEASLQYFGTWFGEYPYGHLTLIDPVFGGGANGMEYPTLVTGGTRFLSPKSERRVERVTAHEVGHQFWYGIVGNNEFEDAWLDEGLTNFSADRTMQVVFGGRAYGQRFFRGYFPVMIKDIAIDRLTEWNMLDAYRRAARAEIPSTASFRYYPGTAGALTYFKTALWLGTLERTLGWETSQKILSTYFHRWKFKHPKPDDLFAVANEVSGRDLTTFFDLVYRSAAVFDFSVDSVTSEEVKTEGFVGEEGQLRYLGGETSKPKLFETRVIVRRLEDGILPVEVLLKFENGEEVRDVWDGHSTWKLYRVVKPTKLDYAVVDPERKLLLDTNYTNNSKRLHGRADLPATKWASKWMIWLQDYMQTISFLF